MKKENVSEAVIRRLPRYYRYLDDLTIRKRFFSYRRILRYIFRQY